MENTAFFDPRYGHVYLYAEMHITWDYGMYLFTTGYKNEFGFFYEYNHYYWGA